MQRISITNPQNIIDGTAKKYYFKLRNTGGPKGDKGDKGDKGQTGPQGPKGDAATVAVGSTTTLPVGYDATVENVGSIYNAVLNFGIPQGPQGPQGAKGDKGDTGAQGETGPRGPQGEKGTNATVYVGTTTTTNPGTQARVYNSGTDSNAVLNFEIPRGDVGPSVPLVQETGYSTTKAMSQNATTEALNGKQNTLTAGSNIQISGSTISATDTTYTAGNNVQISGTIISSTDTTYTAGNGLNLDGTEFSADTTVLATKSDLDNYYTKTETDTKLAPKLEAEVVVELPSTGTEGKLYLTPKARTTQTAIGNPITATVAEDAGAIESFQLDGDTYQQSYTGKNLLAVTRTVETKNGVTCTWDGASFTLNGTTTASTDFYGRGWWGATSNPIALPAGTYTMSLRKSDGSLATDADFSVDCYQGTAHIIGIYRGNLGTGYKTVTFDSDTQYSVLFISLLSGKTYNNEKFYIQLEKSESPTSYEPYVGGQPSPNPDYPQPIQTVTGLQTISINGTDYPLDLGSIELCKLGTYQDYIWKDGDDWKVLKATAMQTIISENVGDWSSYTNIEYATYSKSEDYDGYNTWDGKDVMCDHATFARGSGLAWLNNASRVGNIIANASVSNYWIGFVKGTPLETMKSKLNGAKILYPLATPTDTTITDQTLIAQLEAIRTASLENGTNTITNTPAGSNLAGDMEVGYYGYNPTNRYDKWLWLDLNNNYEKLGS